MNTDDALASIKMNSAERIAALQRQASQVNLTGKDRDTGFLVEFIPSLFGIFGIGYLYAGMTAAGVARIVAAIGIWILYGIISTVTLGCGAITFPLFWIAVVAMGYFSAKELKELLPAKGAAGTPPAGPSGYLEPGRTDQPYASPTPPYQPQQSYTPPAEQAPWQQSAPSGDAGYTPPAAQYPGTGDGSTQASAPSSEPERDDTM